MFGYYYRIEGRVTVTGYIQRYLSKIGFQGLFTEAISAIAAVLARWIVLWIPKMFIDLGF